MNKDASFLISWLPSSSRGILAVWARLLRALIIILSVVIFFSACSNTFNHAPVEDHQAPPSRKLTRHEVAPGETLYAIAWRYNIDYRQLARANGIDSRYTIHPGQILNLDISKVTKPRKLRSKSKSSPAKAVQPGAQDKPVVGHTPATAPSKSEAKSKNPNITSLTTLSSSSKGSENRSASVKKKLPGATVFDPKKWLWPVGGKILGKFHANGGLQKGIDIKSKLGEPVLAAAPGKVVYAGSGLRGYGKLLIIKHNDRYLSAYAHNRRLLAKEGQRVRAGQKIAEVGATGTDSVKLHFEIRNDGRPVDPLLYLPSR